MGNPIVKEEPHVDEHINTPIVSTKVTVDMEVDIVNWTNKGDFASNKDDDPDATETEYSSSFADTTSDAENSSRLSDAEVESEFVGGSSPFRMRKRKVTDHWRNFIRPLAWRCKWTELKLKQIEAQALKYSKELEEYDKRKHRAADPSTLEESGSRSLPFSNDHYRRKAIQRRKRKKVEDTTDIASYTSNHQIFSYLENKKAELDGSVDDDLDNPVITEPQADSTDIFVEDPPLFRHSEADNSLEQLLWTIDTLQSKVRKMKGGLDTVMSNNASRFISSENYYSLLRHDDEQTSAAQSPANSAGNGDAASVSAMYNSAQNAPEFDFGDLGLPGSGGSSFGEAVIPDIIESTAGLLSGADVTVHSALVGDSHEHELTEKEEQNFKNPSPKSTEKVREVKKEEGEEENVNPVSIPQPTENIQEVEAKVEGDENVNRVSIPIADVNNVTTGCNASPEKSSLRSCMNSDVNFPKNKRKRGERKAGSSAWNKQEPVKK